MSKETKIRDGVRTDLPQVLKLIKELATYERAANEVITTVEQMERDGFGPKAIYGFFIAENEAGIVGISLFYWRYSTWKGKRLYLEDIIVTESQRGKGIGKLLFDRTVKHALEAGCTGMMWQVLEWNEPALNFYKKYDSRLDREWINCSLERDQLEELAKALK